MHSVHDAVHSSGANRRLRAASLLTEAGRSARTAGKVGLSAATVCDKYQKAHSTSVCGGLNRRGCAVIRVEVKRPRAQRPSHASDISGSSPSWRSPLRRGEVLDQ